MTIAFAIFLGLCTFCVLILCVELADRWIAKAFPGEPEMPQEKPARPTTRFVTTLYGDTLADGIRRAFILSAEYDEVFLVHDHTPVRVTFESDPYSIETEWNATRKIQRALGICNGK